MKPDRSVICSLQGKLQKHQAFEAEISAHSNAIVELQESGEGMINESHYASDLIRVRLVNLSLFHVFKLLLPLLLSLLSLFLLEAMCTVIPVP